MGIPSIRKCTLLRDKNKRIYSIIVCKNKANQFIYDFIMTYIRSNPDSRLTIPLRCVGISASVVANLKHWLVDIKKYFKKFGKTQCYGSKFPVDESLSYSMSQPPFAIVFRIYDDHKRSMLFNPYYK